MSDLQRTFVEMCSSFFLLKCSIISYFNLNLKIVQRTSPIPSKRRPISWTMFDQLLSHQLLCMVLNSESGFSTCIQNSLWLQNGTHVQVNPDLNWQHAIPSTHHVRFTIFSGQQVNLNCLLAPSGDSHSQLVGHTIQLCLN